MEHSRCSAHTVGVLLTVAMMRMTPTLIHLSILYCNSGNGYSGSSVTARFLNKNQCLYIHFLNMRDSLSQGLSHPSGVSHLSPFVQISILFLITQPSLLMSLFVLFLEKRRFNKCLPIKDGLIPSDVFYVPPVVGILVSPKDVCILIHQVCELASLHGESELGQLIR